MIKLVATDVDGTLLNSHHLLTSRTEDTLRRVAQAGVHVVLATGRQYVKVTELVEQLGTISPQVTSDGAVITDPLSGQALFTQTIPRALCEQMIALAQQIGITLLITRDGLVFATAHNEDTEYTLTYNDPIPILVEDLREALDPLPTMMMAVAYRKDALYEAFEAAAHAQFGDMLRVVRSSPYYLQILHPEASKGKSLARICAELGIAPDEVLAAGDSYNDLSLFDFAQHSVAMGHSPDAVKARATWVTATNDEDGLALALERFVLNGA